MQRFNSWLIVLVATLAILTSQMAVGLVQICKVNELCVDINRPVANSRNDLALRYRYSGPRGAGKKWVLQNGATLKSGDRFTIEITARKAMYLYMFHFDSTGQLYELLSLSKKSNRLQKGQKLILPGPRQHFSLDNNTGTETMHAIVSLVPEKNLMAKYRRALLGNTDIRLAARKGITVGNDPESVAPASNRPVVETNGHTIACQGGAACRQTFIIKHRARR